MATGMRMDARSEQSTMWLHAPSSAHDVTHTVSLVEYRETSGGSWAMRRRVRDAPSPGGTSP